jgi:hypothetical protein
MIELAAMLRLIPYLLVVIIGWKKGYYRLFLVAVILIIISLVSNTLKPTSEVRAVMASVFSLFLLLHALDLKPRNK